MKPSSFATIRPGIYLLEMDTGPHVVALVSDQSDLALLDTFLRSYSPTWLATVDLIRHMRPLERQGGLSGAMYWGEEIR
jgi:hypothetical protein